MIVVLLSGSTPPSVLAATQATAAATPATASASASNSATAKATGNDPLLRYQWHISNQGQAVIGDSRPVAGVDMDVD
ncbi:peptidase S8, partial [Xanthomonas perforans]|nr:peptidase S8 [Xanthomonas perforans]